MSISQPLPNSSDNAEHAALPHACDGCVREGSPVCNETPDVSRGGDLPLPPLDERRKVWQSTDLLGDDCEAIIVHRGQLYRLRCTKQGKLILYK